MNFLIKNSQKGMIKTSSCESRAVASVLKFIMTLFLIHYKI